MSNPRVLLAFDFDDVKQVYSLAEQLEPALCRIKIGKALFTRTGVDVVKNLQNQGFEIFLDLKYHDIPNTVADALRAAADLGVWMVNVHACGGVKMLDAGVKALVNQRHKPLLIAVTVLTSTAESDLVSMGINRSLQMQVEALTRLSYQVGLDGVVCSAHEVGMVKQVTQQSFITVTPGIRPQSSEANDQTRIMTPEQAIIAGSDYLVIGRPITASDNPLQSLKTIVQSIEGIK